MGLNYLANEKGDLSSVILHWPQSMRLADAQFFEFCQANSELLIECTAQGDYEIMLPTGGETGWRNSRLIVLLSQWADQDGRGVVFDSSTGFVLPNGAIRSPDVSWVKKSKLAQLTPEQKRQFLPLCPDFVIELRSPSDNLKNLQDKMQEYRDNGAELGWLIDPEQRRVYEYQPDKEERLFEQPQFLSGGGLLKGFELNLSKVWDIGF